MSPPTYFSCSDWLPSPRPLRDQREVLAIGDLHGFDDLLVDLTHVVQSELTSDSRIVFLGDYIDRGPQMLPLLERLSRGNVLGLDCEEIFLVGNHDQFMIDVLRMRSDVPLPASHMRNWMENGGTATLRSLGLAIDQHPELTQDVLSLQQALFDVIDASILAFLNELRTCWRIDDLLFVHAGIHPEVPLEVQKFEDLLLIREPFLSAAETWPHSFLVVHGHTPSRPEIHPHRIGVDTGVFMSGALSAAQFRDGHVRFLTVATEGENAWMGRLKRGESVPYSTPTAVHR